MPTPLLQPGQSAFGNPTPLGTGSTPFPQMPSSAPIPAPPPVAQSRPQATPQPTDTGQLDDASRTKLDGIVQQMVSNKESDTNIQAVVNDFKAKNAASSQSLGSKLRSNLVGNTIGNNPGSLKNAVIGTANALTSSEQNVGGEISSGFPASMTGEQQLNQANQGNAASDISFIQAINQMKASGKHLTTQQQEIFHNVLKTNSSVGKQTDLLPHAADTNAQALGNVGQVGLDMLSAGSYGAEARAATSFSRYVAPAVEQFGKMTLGQIGKQTAVRSATGGAVGYGYDVTNNLQQGKTGTDALTPGAATLAGATIPALIGGFKAGVAISKDQASRFINSLIKPKTADFAYGKDPGRTVAELGITGNSLPDFEKNITTAKNDVVGAQIGAIYDLPANQAVRINAAPEINKIDSAIADAAKGGKSNQGIVTQLMNIKDGLLYEHGVNDEGVITKIGDTPRDLSNLSPKEAQAFIQHVADQTKFTGNPSDDKIVNSTLQSVYGGIRDAINTAVSPNNPEILKLNEQYGDLTSAELAVKNRAAIMQRSNMTSPVAFSKPLGAASAAALTAFLSGGTTVPVALAAIGAAGIEKALETTAVKTRIAAWLGKESPTVIQSYLSEHPDIAPQLTQAFPALVGKLTAKNPTQ